MKKILFAVSAVALALSAGSAFAADLPSRKEAPIYIPPPPPPMWTGFYAGLNIGGGWGDNGGSTGDSAYFDPKFAIGSTPTTGFFRPRPIGPANLFFEPNGNTLGTAGGVVGGAQVGYNYQFGQFVIGVETDFQGSSISGGGNNASQSLILSPYGARGSEFLAPIGALAGANTSLEWFGTVRGRVGYLFLPTLLIYGTGGFAYGQVNTFGFTTPTPAGPRAAAWSGCSRRIGRRRRNISLSISPTMERPAARASISAPGSIRSTTSCALA
jgi:outer membrane immunogenic protein